MNTTTRSKTRVGLIGYGSLGQYLAKAIFEDESIKSLFELVFVYNRTTTKLDSLPNHIYKFSDLTQFESSSTTAVPDVDIIVEVSHPNIIQQYGSAFLNRAHLFVGSPTALADLQCEASLKHTSQLSNKTMYIPSGALWGATDIAKMSDRNTLGALSISMSKHPLSLKLEKPLSDQVDAYINDENAMDPIVVYEGCVRDLCPLAPNNVNTMACAAIAGSSLGFGKVQAKLIADKSLQAHVIDIDVQGINNNGFRVTTQRYNPAQVGAVTGNATYVSFLSSLKACSGMSNNGGFCFC
jgi:aspartate dehydrogenase